MIHLWMLWTSETNLRWFYARFLNVIFIHVMCHSGQPYLVAHKVTESSLYDTTHLIHGAFSSFVPQPFLPFFSHVSFVKGNFITFVVEGHTVLLFRTAWELLFRGTICYRHWPKTFIRVCDAQSSKLLEEDIYIVATNIITCWLFTSFTM